MSHSQADNWSLARSVAFLAAVFAIALGSLLPFAAMASARPGHPIVICSAEGPQTIQVGGVDGPAKQNVGVKCAACVMPLAAALPAPPAPMPVRAIRPTEAVVYAPVSVSPPPPARAPPRPPSTAPPTA